MARIELFRDENYLGSSIILTDSNEDLAVLGFNDAVSSVVVYSGTFTFFQNRAFEGFSFTVSRRGGQI
jgi:Beta/Gamma crystallin